jgi:quercetin dioxygenase-like cupin family protein
VHRGPLRLLLFTFEPGGGLPEHRAPGHVVIHCLRGQLAVEAAAAQHRLNGGEALVLEPDVPHSVQAVAESEMLLTVCIGCPGGPADSGRPNPQQCSQQAGAGQNP